MLKNKLFLNGLGTGLIIGAILLQLMISVSEAENKPLPESEPPLKQEVNDLDALKETAKELGYQLYTQEEMDKLLKAAKEETYKQSSVKIIKAFVIPSGSAASEVANMLLDLKLIADKQSFEDALSQKQLNSKIQPGYYQFEGTPKLAEVIKKITKP